MGHDGVVRGPRRIRDAVVPDLAEARVRVTDHMVGRGFRRGSGSEGGGGDEGGSSKGTKVTHGRLSPDGVFDFFPLDPLKRTFAEVVSFGASDRPECPSVSAKANLVQTIGFRNDFKMASSRRLQSYFRWSKSCFRWRIVRAWKRHGSPPGR